MPATFRYMPGEFTHAETYQNSVSILEQLLDDSGYSKSLGIALDRISEGHDLEQTKCYTIRCKFYDSDLCYVQLQI